MKNIVKVFIGLIAINIQVAIYLIPVFLFFFGVVYLLSFINIYYLMSLYATIGGLILGWAYIDKSKSKVDFYFSVAVAVIFPGLFSSQYFENSISILIVSMGLSLGYSLYRLNAINTFGFITFLKEIRSVYYHFKYDKLTFRWLALYYRCKIKKLKVYIYGKYGHYSTSGKNTEEIIITISKNGELSINSIGEDIENEKLSFGVITGRVIARLGIYPNIKVIITGDYDIPANMLFSLLIFLQKNGVDEVGLKPAKS
ncbi:hypothetical protein HN615_15320 [Candidatus Woesearchaeota archaeon]|jgi:hypothetical protein|nr:hypothetical protein [Candidatus Woesearchaeota archaeon]